MAEMTSQLLKAKGFTVDKRAGLGTAPLRQAQEAGQIDVYWEYTGTSLITFNKVTDKLDAARDLRQGQGARRRQGPRLAQPVEGEQHLRARDAKADDDAKKGIKTLSDLAAKVKGGRSAKFGCNAEFYARPDGLDPLQAAYGFEFGRENVIAHGHRPRLPGAARTRRSTSASSSRPTAACRPSTSSSSQDDKGFFPNYALTPVVRKEIAGQEPEARRDPERALGEARRRHDGEAQRLGRRGQEDASRRSRADFLKAQGLV